MFDMNTAKVLIHSIFQGGASRTLSKQVILSRLEQLPAGQEFLSFCKAVPNRNDYTEDSLTKEVQNAAQKEGVVGNIRSKVGI